MMNSWKTAGLIGLILTLSLAAATSCNAAPKIQVDQAVYDAGSVPEGKDITHEFILKNVGDQKLTFKAKPC